MRPARFLISYGWKLAMDRNAASGASSSGPANSGSGGPGQRPGHVLVLGGAASGKSRTAETLVTRLAEKRGLTRVYLATARIHDDEMRTKVRRHELQRGPGWTTREVPLDVPQALSSLSAQNVVLLDCATLWLTNLLLEGHDLEAEQTRLISALHGAEAPVFIVSNEVGAGIVPENALARQFREAQGQLNQRLAGAVENVVAVMAGLPLVLKGTDPAGWT